MSTGVVRHTADDLGPDPEDRPDLILVVDDDQDIASFVAFNLEIQGYEVMRAKDGQEALELLETRRPDLAVIDWMMPRMDGVELTQRLRAEPLTSALPVIMLTAKSMSIDKVLGLTAGVDDYLVKPFDTAELIARVSSTLRRNKEFREVSPLTGLPGNARVRREIADRMKAGGEYSVGYIDIDRFKSVNDVYGFDRGDEFIGALARSLHRAVSTINRPPIFLGHIGGDDFVFICAPDQVLPADQAHGHRLRAGGRPALRPGGRPARLHRGARPARQPATGPPWSPSRSAWPRRRSRAGGSPTPRVVIAVASEMKKVAKSQPGSYVAIDRRRSDSELEE